MNNSTLKVVAVSDDSLRPELLDALMIDDGDCNNIVVESIRHAYSRIRELEPNLVVVFMEIEDEEACQLLSMIELDHRLRDVQVVTCATGPERAATHLLCGIAQRSRLPDKAALHR